MKRLNFLLVVWCLCLLGATAEPVDKTTAQATAQAFLKYRHTAQGSPRYAPGRQPQVALAGQVSGLYVYNVKGDGGGFVIVSNDDATVPVLGYADSGCIDPDHMPDNMRAWLQGYADQIAWYRQHAPKTAHPRRAAKRCGQHPTTDVEPMLRTTWDQGAPFNDLCPYVGGSRTVTGCAATAMAQVMRYHEWPQATVTAIPGYTTESYGLNLKAGLPATVFDWDNMKDSYRHGYTAEEGAAVAKLMQYCGYAVKMDYGPESAAYSQDVVTAFREYFDYSATTQLMVRSMYSAANWADIIYHELAQGRPVLYCGQSSTGGHAFVCDGYKYEGETDFFHINWGWNGLSDNYFVLSALDPGEQGIGGSESKGGYRVAQEAIVGIQPSTGTGTVLDITPHVVDLTVNGMTLETDKAYVGFPMDITLNMTNNSTDDYDGTIYVGCQYEDGESVDYGLLVGDVCQIAAGETADVVIEFSPYDAGTYNLVAFLPCPDGMYETDERVLATLNVEWPPTDGLVPVYSSDDSELSRSQFIIPAADLQDKLYASLNDITFYYVATWDNLFVLSPWGAAEFDVCLAEVSESAFADNTLKDWTTLEKVYTGTLSAYLGKMKVDFDTPYQYMGGNLLVGVRQKTVGNVYGFDWIGTTVPGASLGGSSNTGVSQRDFLPRTTFGYTPGTAPAVAKPVAVSVNYTGGGEAEVKWTSTEGAWDIEVNGTVTENVTNPYRLTGLEPATAYTVRVRAKNDRGVSEWSSPATFNTELADDWCQIRFELIDYYGDGWNGATIKVVDKLTGAVIGTVSGTNTVEMLEPQTFIMDVPNGRDINFVWNRGGADEDCSYVVYDLNGDVILSGHGAMSKPVTWHVDCDDRSWHIPSSLTAENIGPHSTGLTWTENGEATAWVVAYKSAADADFTEVNATKNPFTLTGLADKTKYTVRVRPATDEATKWSAETVFTTDIPNPEPTRLAVTPAATKADLTWEGFTDNYEIRYGIGVLPDDCKWLQYDNGTYKNSWGYNKPNTLTWAVRYPNSEVKGKVLKKVSWYETCRNHEGDITVGIYSGGDAPGKLLYTQKVTPDVDDGFHELTLRTPVSVKPGENLWIVLTAKGTHVISYCRCNEPDNQWVYKDRKFQHLADWKADYAGYGWMIRGYVEAAVDESSIEWKKTTTTERACQLTALTPETDYVVQVRGNYGEEGISQWTTTAFTTVSPCDAPNTLLTSNITPNTASVTWTGYQDNYDLRYKVNLTPDVTADFDDSSLGDWTTIDADGDGYGWVIYTTDTIYHNEECGGYDYVVLPGRGHNGSYDRVISGSYSPFTWEGLRPDNYLVSPQVSLGGTVTFWACAESDLGDHFGLAVSTTGNTDAADFTTIQEWTTDEWQVWKQYTVDLSAYKGQTGYVAIRHFNCYNRFVVAVDDIVIEMPDDGKPWTTVENISGNSYKLTGLTDQTPYKVQVRGNNTPCGTHTPWSEVATFTTLQGGATKIATTDAQQPVINTGWYSIDGRRLNHKPTQKGIYIHNGRKVVM